MKHIQVDDMQNKVVEISKININIFILFIIFFLVLAVPMINAASISLVASKNKYNPGDTLVVLGTSTPGSAVAIQVFNPNGVLMGVNQAETRDDGQYVIEVFNWPDVNSSNTPFGIYQVKAVDAASGESTKVNITFAESTKPPIPPITPPKEEIQTHPIIFEILISTSSTYQLGDEVRGIILFKLNGTLIYPTEKTVNIYSIEGEGFSSEIINLISINKGMYYFNYFPNKIGTYFVNVNGNINGTNNIEISSFQVVERFITQTNIDDIQNILTNIIYQAQNDIQNDVKDNIDQELSSLQSDLMEKINDIPILIENSSLSSKNSIEELISQTTTELEDNIQSNLNSTRESLLQTIEDEHNQVISMKNNLDSVNIGVSNASIWITVVGLISLITLVLELMMFVRKLS